MAIFYLYFAECLCSLYGKTSQKALAHVCVSAGVAREGFAGFHGDTAIRTRAAKRRKGVETNESKFLLFKQRFLP